jgi:hypothetical protein
MAQHDTAQHAMAAQHSMAGEKRMHRREMHRHGQHTAASMGLRLLAASSKISSPGGADAEACCPARAEAKVNACCSRQVSTAHLLQERALQAPAALAAAVLRCPAAASLCCQLCVLHAAVCCVGLCRQLIVCVCMSHLRLRAIDSHPVDAEVEAVQAHTGLRSRHLHQ